MSDDQHLVCTQCHHAIWIAQDGMSGFTFYSGEPACMNALREFLREHFRHPLKFVSEWDCEDDWHIEWTRAVEAAERSLPGGRDE